MMEVNGKWGEWYNLTGTGYHECLVLVETGIVVITERKQEEQLTLDQIFHLRG